MTQDEIAAAVRETAKLAEAVIALTRAVEDAPYVDHIELAGVRQDADRTRAELRRLSGERPQQ